MALKFYSITVGNLIDDSNGKNYAPNKVVYISDANGALANIYTSESGTIQIPQNGSSNITDGNGVFSFWAEGSSYTAQIDSISYKVYPISGNDGTVSASDVMTSSGDTVEQRLIDIPIEVSATVNAAADRAEAAADAAAISANIYATVAAGLAATVSGDYFNVLSSENLNYTDLYLNNAGTGEFQKSYPATGAVDKIRDLVFDTHVSTAFNFISDIPIIQGSYYATGGTIENSATWSRTVKFKVVPGQEYTFVGRLTSTRNIHLFDANGAYLRDARSDTFDTETYTFTAGGDVHFAGASLLDSQSNQTFKLTTAYVSPDLASSLDYETKANAESERSILADEIKNILVENTVNLLDPNGYIQGSYYATGGTIQNSATWSRTPQIPVKRNTKYTYAGRLTSSRNIHIFNSNGEYIRDARSAASDTDLCTFDTGEGDFVGISILDGQADQIFSTEKPIVNDAIISANALEVKPHTQKGGTYKLLQAVVTNPLDKQLSHHIVSISVSFKDGEVLNDNCLELVQYADKTVRDTAGTGTVIIKDFTDPIPCQFAGDVNDNLRFDDREDGYYSSGYLKNGRIYFYANFANRETKTFYVKVYSGQVKAHDPAILVSDTNDSGGGQYIDAVHPNGNTNYRLQIDGALTPLQMIIDGVSTYTGTRRLFYTSTIKGDGTTVVSMQPNTPQTAPDYLYSSIKYSGSGVIFKDVDVSLVHNEHKNLLVSYKFRMFSNGFVDVDATCKFTGDQDADVNKRIDQLYHSLQINYASGTDTYSAVTPDTNYVNEGHHRISINKGTDYSVSGLIYSQTTQGRPSFDYMSDLSSASLGGTTLRLQAGLRQLAADVLGEGAYLNSQLRFVFSTDVDNISQGKYDYSNNHLELLNRAQGTLTDVKPAKQKESLLENIESITDAISRHITQPTTGRGSYAQFQLASILLGGSQYTIDQVLANYQSMREQYRNVGITIDYFESYFGISLAQAQADDDGVSYYPPLSSVNPKPFATQALGRDFHITRALIDYYNDENSRLQNLIDSAQGVIDNPSSSQSLKDAMTLEIERHNLDVIANNALISDFTNEIKSLADSCVHIVKYNNRFQKFEYDSNGVDQVMFEPRGRVSLQWRPDAIEPLNASTAIMRFLSDAMELLPGDGNFPQWQLAYNDLRYYVTNFLVSDTNIIPYAYDRDVSIKNDLHYSAYTLYDFTACEVPSDFNAKMQLLELTLSSGVLLELSSTSANRRGLINTYLYVASIILSDGNVNDWEVASRILKTVNNYCFTSNDDFSRTITINDWENNQTLEQQDFDVTASGTILRLVKLIKS